MWYLRITVGRTLAARTKAEIDSGSEETNHSYGNYQKQGGSNVDLMHYNPCFQGHQKKGTGTLKLTNHYIIPVSMAFSM